LQRIAKTAPAEKRRWADDIMKVAQNNPATNVLRSGVSDEMVEQAIHSSGYPLQLVVAQQLSREFSLTSSGTLF